MRKKIGRISLILNVNYVSFPFYSFPFPWSPLYPHSSPLEDSKVYPPASWLSVCVLTTICEGNLILFSAH